MKPSSPAPSSSSPSSYGGRGGRATSNCLSRILRRILCFSNLPLYSFDRFKVDEVECSVAIGAPDATPGVVARLMGLDSVPPAEPIKESPSFPESADPLKASRLPRARRARDIPPYRELEDDKFFILSFEKRHVSHIGKMKSNSRRIRPSMEGRSSKGEKSRRDNSKGKNKENENPSKKSKKKMAKNGCFAEAITLEYEGDSENSSPNSVLEFERFSADQQFLPPGEISRLENSRTRRPLSEELENCEDLKGKDPIGGLELGFGGEDLVKSKKKQPNGAGKLGEIGKFAAMEAKWMHEELMKNKHCLMEIGGDVASSIFDHLLEELVINL